ncbi:twisted gastrulation protein homolog 1 isoform X1 [Heliangelus exortis]|uniref:twisted gastrulation protein homolog 1 isoform X1 n=2 Tax=Heliangelus exortis TaxID=472823 RepID=UPI003A95660B
MRGRAAASALPAAEGGAAGRGVRLLLPLPPPPEQREPPAERGCPARGAVRAGCSTCENCSPAGNMRSQYVTVPTAILLLFLLWIQSSTGCNKALCASDVSKCLIQELCQCRPGEGNCSCCKECMLCLGTLWDECCDCVGMCNPRNYSDTPPTSKSTVEELHEPIPSLFRALTEGDTQLNWNIVSFPVAEELSHHENLVSFLETVNQPQHQNVSVPSNNVHTPYSSDKEHMCTVVYFDDCMSIHQCKISCESMGASKYRWFHNACCECIGPECIDYGSKTVKCMNCMF